MHWFAASIVIGLKPEQDTGACMAYENIVLVQAASFEAAEAIAVEHGKIESDIDEGLYVNGIAATRKFLGVRKVVAVSNPHPMNPDEDRPDNLSEITYSLFKASDWGQLQLLASGEAVTIEYIE